MADHTKSRSHDAAWRRVEDSLRDLADAIGHAGRTPAEADEQRRRMGELASGLSSLADGIRASMRQAEPAEQAPRPSDESPAGRTVPPAEACPQAFNAVMAAKEKFREAAERFEHPSPAATEASPFPPLVTGSTVPAAVVTAPEPSPVTESGSDAAAPGQQQKVSSLDRLNAIRAAHERFVVERRAAEEEASSPASGQVPDDATH